MSSYYLRYRQRVLGPFAAKELKDMAAKGQLTELHMLSEDREFWTPVREVRGLFPEDTDGPVAAGYELNDPPPSLSADPEGNGYMGWRPPETMPEPPVAPASADILGGKRKTTATLLSFFLGGVGAHDVYRGAWGWGLLCIPLLVTGLPIVRGVVDGIRFLTMSQERFDEKFNLNPVTPWTSCWE